MNNAGVVAKVETRGDDHLIGPWSPTLPVNVGDILENIRGSEGRAELLSREGEKVVDVISGRTVRRER